MRQADDVLLQGGSYFDGFINGLFDLFVLSFRNGVFKPFRLQSNIGVLINVVPERLYATIATVASYVEKLPASVKLLSTKTPGFEKLAAKILERCGIIQALVVEFVEDAQYQPPFRYRLLLNLYCTLSYLQVSPLDPNGS